MTQYPYHNNRKNKSKIYLVIFLLLSFVLIITLGGLGYLGNTLHSTMRPLWIFGNRISDVSGNADILLKSKTKLIEENKKLEEDLLRMSLLVMERTILMKENKDLKEMFGRVSADTRILASILSDGKSAPSGLIVIDQGTISGIKKDDVVYVANVGIGTIETVFNRTALMRLFSDFGQSVEVLVGDENITATAQGRGGGNFLIEMPRDVLVEIGDMVLFRVGEQRMLGVIEHIDTKPNDPFKKLLFRSPVDIQKIRWVEVESYVSE